MIQANTSHIPVFSQFRTKGDGDAAKKKVPSYNSYHH